MRDVTWFLTGWHWLYTALAACLLFWLGYIALGTARIVADWWQEHRDAPALDAYFDDVEDGYLTIVDDDTFDRLYTDLDLPGPESLPAPWAGEHHLAVAGQHYMDTWLGRPGDGSEHTALRVEFAGRAMLKKFDEEWDELCRESGVRHIPVWQSREEVAA